MKTEEETELTPNPQETVTDNILDTVRPFLLGIGILAFILTIWVLLPMFFTYLSEGDTRAPSQIHAADPLNNTERVVHEPIKPNKYK